MVGAFLQFQVGVDSPICNYYITASLSFEVLLLNTRNKNWLLESYFYKPATITPYTLITILCILFLFSPFYKRYTHNTQSKPCSILGFENLYHGRFFFIYQYFNAIHTSFYFVCKNSILLQVLFFSSYTVSPDHFEYSFCSLFNARSNFWFSFFRFSFSSNSLFISL